MPATTFDAIADIYDGAIPAHVANHYLEKRVRFIHTLLLPRASVLDVGCGTGTLCRRLQGEAFKTFGVDDSEGMLRKAREKEIPVTRAQAQTLPFADETFDAVLAVAVLHHLGSQELVKGCIREMLRIVRRNGVAVIWDHNPLNPYWPILMRRVPQDCGTERLVPLREIVEVAAGHRACSITHCRLGFIPDFISPKLLPLFQRLERQLESWSLTNWLAAHNVVVVRKG
jgi:SAM-dependent methyltransferase